MTALLSWLMKNSCHSCLEATAILILILFILLHWQFELLMRICWQYLELFYLRVLSASFDSSGRWTKWETRNAIYLHLIIRQLTGTSPQFFSILHFYRRGVLFCVAELLPGTGCIRDYSPYRFPIPNPFPSPAINRDVLHTALTTGGRPPARLSSVSCS